LLSRHMLAVLMMPQLPSAISSASATPVGVRRQVCCGQACRARQRAGVSCVLPACGQSCGGQRARHKCANHQSDSPRPVMGTCSQLSSGSLQQHGGAQHGGWWHAQPNSLLRADRRQPWCRQPATHGSVMHDTCDPASRTTARLTRSA
jgi:hypothetical protein